MDVELSAESPRDRDIMNTTLSIGTVKQVTAILIAVAIVVAAGVIVGQAPAIFGADVDDDPEASITFTDQEGNGTSVVVDTVSLSDGGFVVVGDGTGGVFAVSEYLDDGTHENVTVEQLENDDRELLGQLTATVHQDTTEDGEFVYEETDREEDLPYVEGGYPVSDTATVTPVDRPGDVPTDSFVVESVEGPTTATTNQTVEFVAEIRNPTADELRQHTEFRVDGELFERQVQSLEGDETREVTFEVDMVDVGPGNYTYGVYTVEDGVQDEIDVEFDGPPSVSVVEADPSTVVVDAGLPEGGFVAVEDADGEVLATSDELDAALHENVTIDVDEAVEANETRTVVAFEGDPDPLEDASAYEVDGERVEVTIEFDDDGDYEVVDDEDERAADADDAADEDGDDEDDA